MRPCRGSAVATLLVLAALAAAGCGLGPGDTVGEVSLTVTRDHGAEPLVGPLREEVSESDTVMRVLEREAEITTRYGGGFVDSIDGLAEGLRDGRRYDWFFYVNGLWSPVGAAEYPLRGGEAIWWDYRDWSGSNRVSAVVGSWPQPFAGGYEGRRRPTAVECLAGGAACGEARRRLRDAGAELAAAGTKGATRVLVGPWAALRRDPQARILADGSQASGVYAEFEAAAGGYELVGLDEAGEPGRVLGAAGLVAAIRLYGGPPAWLVTGADAGGALAAARALDADHLRDRYAVAVTEGGETVPLPLR